MLKLKEIRSKLKLKQQDIADILQVSQVQASRLEKEENSMTIEQAASIVKALNLRWSDLLGDESEIKKGD